jgi:hypothetical protein
MCFNSLLLTNSPPLLVAGKDKLCPTKGNVTPAELFAQLRELRAMVAEVIQLVKDLAAPTTEEEVDSDEEGDSNEC